MKSKLSCAITAILGGLSCAESWAAAEPASEGLEEITVTATRRSESMQDVPISMQAFTAQALQQLNISTFDDYIKYLPNVTHGQQRAGTERGVHARPERRLAAQPGQRLDRAVAQRRHLPGQPIRARCPNRNLDIYAADLNRIEVLEGPQGTLFGSGAEAGVIRYITNEPKIDVTEGSIKAGYGVTAHGDPNSDVTGGAQSAADRRAPGGARGDLRRSARRLHRQRPGERSRARTPTSASTTRTILPWAAPVRMD